MTTTKLVSALLSESKEVKNSVGGTKSFRDIMNFVLLKKSYQDDDKMEIVERTNKEIASLIEKEFETSIIDEVKGIYK